ncbi:MAG: hypothetical protein JSS56_29760 [Proteobacteria bacterium]|nr:hypothetical protein [Pseudomonadota bacterium]
MMVYKGESRIPGVAGAPHMVRLTNKIGDQVYEISEQEYRRHVFSPPLETLPWLEAASARDESNACADGYQLTVIAKGISPNRLKAAQPVARQALEDGVGGGSQVLPSFKAYAKLHREGPTAMTKDETVAAAAWLLAADKARAAAQGMLGHTGNVDILFKLDTQ